MIKEYICIIVILYMKLKYFEMYSKEREKERIGNILFKYIIDSSLT